MSASPPTSARVTSTTQWAGRVGAEEVAARVSRLIGTRCDPVGVLSERALPAGGTALVVAVRTASGTVLVAKQAPPDLVATGVRAQTAAAASVRRGGLGVLRVPQVVATESGLAVTEWAPGVPLHRSIRRGDMDAVRHAGRALAELALCSSDARPRLLADHFAEIVFPHPGALAGTGLDEPLVRAVQRMARAARAVEVVGPSGLVHRDVHPRQLHVDGSRVWLLDWDLATCGDPALDLANLLQHHRARLAEPVARRVIASLLDGYAPSSDALDRLPALEAFTAVRLACKAARLRGAAAAPEVTALLDRAQAALTGVDRHG